MYLFKGSGGDSAEVSTGGIVEVRDVDADAGRRARPDASLPTLTGLLGRYTQVAGVPEAITTSRSWPRAADQDLRQQVQPDARSP